MASKREVNNTNMIKQFIPMLPFRTHFFFTLFFSALSALCFAQTSVRGKTNIDDNWKFSFGHSANPYKDFNYSTAPIFPKLGGAARTAIDARFNDNTWRTSDTTGKSNDLFSIYDEVSAHFIAGKK